MLLSKKIVLTLTLLLFFVISYSQTKEYNVSGIVVAESAPLPGATIIVKNTGRGTISDITGKFSIKVPENATIKVSFIGFIAQEIRITQNRSLNIELVQDAAQLEELVVIGYGSLKKSDLTGSVSSVKAEDIASTSMSSLDQGLQGRASGVVVTQTSGQPGASTSIRIRGTSSINGNNEPLYVIDGVPMISDPTVGTTGAVTGPSLNPLASINPSDVESVEILKDASSTAIYGARGANGVILVTTKRGNKGEAKISFDVYRGIQEIRKKISLLNAKQLAELGNEAADNANVDRKIIYASPTNLGEGTDWQDEIFRHASIENYQLSVSKNSEGSSYAISANYFSQEGIIIGSDFKKGNFRVNLDKNLKKNIKLGASLNFNRSVSNGVVTDTESATASSVTSWALEFNPGLSVYDENGDYVFENNTSTPAVGNPVQDANETEQVSKSNRFLGNFYVDFPLLKDLDFRTSIGVDAYFNKEQSFVPNNVKRGESSNGQAASGNINGYTWIVENTLNYKKDIFKNHRLNVLLGHSLQEYRSESLYAATSDFDDNRLGFNAIQAGSNKTLSLTDNSEWQMQSIISRINYNINEKYLITASLRIDGSSKFGENNKWGYFPSFSAAWRISQEEFLKNDNVINNLKLRGGYGEVGNEGIPSYSSLGLLEITEAYFGETEIAKGMGPYSIENQELKWETTSQFDIGLDLGMFSNRLSIVADYYYKKTRDLLLNSPVPYTSGYESAYMNIGNLENKGFELAINSVNTAGAVKWTSSFNIAFNNNSITKLASTGDEGLTGESMLGISGWTRITEGEAIGTFYGYKADGIIQLTENLDDIAYFSDSSPEYGDRKYIDQNNDGVINEEDKVILGNANPDFTFGLSNNLQYKNFSLNVYLQGSYGNEIVNFNKFSLESLDGTKNNSTATLGRWTPDNPTNKYPRANASPRANALSNAQVEDGSYLRVKDITLSYVFPTKITDRLNVSNLKIYISGKNLFTVTDYSGYDPEVSRFSHDNLSMGADYGSYPSVKTYMIGVNVSF